MENAPPDGGRPRPQPGLDDQPERRYSPWCGSGGRRPATPVAHYWVAAMGVLVAFVLLLNFYQVVRGAVQQGEVQRLAWEQRRPMQTASAPTTSGAARSKVTVARLVETAYVPE